jgi:DNA mismatch repair ATPase MutS
MHPDRDLDLERPLPANAEALEQDLELGTILDVMAMGDHYLRRLAERALLLGLTDPEAIHYRQQILADCLAHPTVVRELYQLTVEGGDTKKNARFYWFRDSPDSLLQKSVGMLTMLADVLARLRKLTEDNTAEFHSAGFGRLFATLERELDDEYLRTVADHLRELRFRRGALLSASLGRANRSTNYVLRKPREQRLLERITPSGPASYSFTIADRDDYGMQALSDMRGRGINLVANALAQSTDHILDFFATLRAELGFYIGCLNLHAQLAAKGLETCFPDPLPAGERTTSARGLYDAALAFHLPAPPVGNDLDADGRQLVIITGANQGGKSTFLRSVGLAQLMMQAGMVVTASIYRASICDGVFSHFKREEDPTMTRGKLEEELNRMSEIADQIAPNSLLLCNESFASTNEREGSEIARQVIRAMVEANVTVFFVTHLYDLADSLHDQQPATTLFLRAERHPDGQRTFRMTPGKPLPTSYGQDSYRRIFALSVGDGATERESPNTERA